jgi:signal transduction histidine kinase/DNA-binding NarL/FixJ family response regulator
MRRSRRVTTALLLCLATLAGAERFTVGSGFSSSPLSGYVDFCSYGRYDPERPKAAEILGGARARDFLPFRKSNLGISDMEHWLRIPLELEAGAPDTIFLEIASSDLDLVELYQPGEDGDYRGEPLREGRRVPGELSGFPLQNAVFRLDQPRGDGPETRTLYLRVVSEDFVKLPLRLTTIAPLLRTTRDEFFVDVLVLGILFGLFCYNLFLAVSTRSRFYVFYLLYLTSMFLYIMCSEGYARYYLFPPGFFLATKGSMLFSYCAVVCGAFFAFSLYDTARNYPVLDRITKACIGLLALCATFNVFTRRAVFYNTASLIEALCMVLLIVIIVRAIIKLKSRSAWYYGISWVPMLAVVILYQFQNAGIYQTTTSLRDFSTRQGMNLATAFQAIMVSLALGDFLNTLKMEKTSALIEKGHAEELSRAKTDYFLELAHEMKTPLTVINGQTDRLLAGEEGELASGAKLALTAVRRNGSTLMRTVTDVLDIGMIDVSGLQPRIRSVRIGLLLKGLEAETLFIARQRKVDLAFSYPEDYATLVVRADSELSSQALMNVITNALKYTPAGGKVRVELCSTRSSILIAVDDSGPGIGEDDPTKLFERYHRLENARNSEIQGTGIGLFAAKKIMTLQEGEITAAKSRFGGARFLLEFSLAAVSAEDDEAEAPDAALQAGSTEGPDGRDARLFIVEDDPDLRQLLLAVLSKEFDCAAFDNARDALESLGRGDMPALVLSDILMPKTDGLAFMEQARAIRPGLSFVFITASDSGRVRDEALRQGALDCIRKPFVPEELRQRLRNIVSHEAQILERIKRRISEEVETAFSRAPSHPEPIVIESAGLSAREQQVAALVLEGKSDKEIAAALDISAATVSTHIQHLYRKCEVRSRAELLVKYRSGRLPGRLS